MIYKFVSHKVSDTPPDCEAKTFHERIKADGPDSLTREEKDRLAEIITCCYTIGSGIYLLGGWAYDFRDMVHKYWVSAKYWGISEYYAPDKTSLRKCFRGSLQIQKIVEVA